MPFETVSFQSAIRGYHFYRNVWQPQKSEILACYHEYGNIYDMFAIKTCRTNSEDGTETESVVGHLPIEVSRLTKFLLDRGATVTATLTSTSYRRSPLVQGGLEIPCLVQARMIGTQINKIVLSKYLAMVNDTFVEPDPDEMIIVGTFLQEEPDVAVENSEALSPAPPRKENKKKKKSDPPPRSKDIRDLFKQQMLKAGQEGKEDDEVSIICVLPPQPSDSEVESDLDSA